MTLDAASYPALIALADAVGVDPTWFLAIFALESGLQSNPPGNTSYVGLNQLAVSQLQSQFHLDRATYAAYPPSKQLTDVVTPWYEGVVNAAHLGHPPSSLGALYAFNLAPGVVASKGDAPDVVLYTSPSAAYTANKPLDYNNDGAITIDDLTNFLSHNVMTRQPYLGAAAILKAYENANPSPPAPIVQVATATSPVVVGTVLAGLGVAGWLFWRYVISPR